MAGADFPFIGVWVRTPQVDKPLKSTTHGHCDAKTTITFPISQP